MTLRESVCDLTAYHALDDPRLGDIISCSIECLDRGTVSYDRDLVCYIRNFVELVGDDDHRHALALKLLHEVEKCS